jgi:hypothetical protein
VHDGQIGVVHLPIAVRIRALAMREGGQRLRRARADDVEIVEIDDAVVVEIGITRLRQRRRQQERRARNETAQQESEAAAC